MSDFESTVRALARKYALENAVKFGGKATPGAVVGKVMGEAPAEWKPRGREMQPLIAAVVEEVNAMAPEAQKAAFDEVASTLVKREKVEREGPLKPLPNATKGKVVLRLAPNPSGPPHFGHGRGMVITDEYKRMYEGVFILRFDDTDTTVKPPWPPAYEMFQETVAWLTGRKPDRVIYASDRIQRHYEVARHALSMGALYVCECEGDAFRAYKERAEDCPHRAQSVETNLAKWDDMLAGKYKRGTVAVRVKTSMQDKDPALRDWVAFRIADEPHPRVGDRYRVWPLLDFQSAVDDHDEGVTHIIRGKDLRDSTAKQEFLYEHLGWTYPETMYWGRVSVHEFGKFSKSILNKAIEAGEYTGWDDPRLPTFPALRRRGFTPEGIRNFWLSFGISEKDVAASQVTLEAENKKILEPAVNRYFFVPNPRPLSVGGTGALEARAPLHPDKPERGARHIHLASPVHVRVAAEDLPERGPLRLKDLCNVEVDAGAATFEGNDLAWAKKRRAPIVQWVGPDAVPARLVLPDASVQVGLAEPALAREPVGSIVQLERVGFARVDAHEPELTLYFAHR